MNISAYLKLPPDFVHFDEGSVAFQAFDQGLCIVWQTVEIGTIHNLSKNKANDNEKT